MARPGPQPLFHGVSRHIAGKIEAGELTPGDRLPSERWFGDALGVSRTTVRRAINELLTTGAIEARGRAIYVSHRSGDAPTDNTLVSLTELARERGLTPSAQVLIARVRPATLDEADVFRVGPGADLFELERVRLLDGTAIAVEHDLLPLRCLPDALNIDFTRASLYASLKACGQMPVRTRMQIEARAATEREAKFLDLPQAAPVLVASERTINQNGQIFVLGLSVFRSDRHRFLATFHLSAGQLGGQPGP
jgi:GntR family transcriptional regulator